MRKVIKMYENLRRRLTKRGFVETNATRKKYNPETGEKLDEVNPSYRLELDENIITLERRGYSSIPQYGVYKSILVTQTGYEALRINITVMNPDQFSEDYIITLIDLLLSQQATPV